MDGELQLTLLGEPQVILDGTPLMDFTYKKSLALFSYLAVTRRPHSRETLAGLLWGEATEANARAGLRKALVDLRQQVPAHLVITRKEAALNQQRLYWLDVATFDRHIGEAERQGSSLTDKAVASLAQAIELYRGDFLEGFYVHRAPAFEEWTLLERERLRLCALRALHVLAAHYAAQGEYGPAIGYIARLLALEPTQEEAHRQMMSLLARTEQQGAAVRQYYICRHVLIQELGVEPAEETMALYERIRYRNEESADPTLPSYNLPIPLTPCIGREAELAKIAKHLRSPDCRLLTLIGPGGGGKTRLALEAAAGQLEHFEHGVYWVSLAPVDPVGGIVHAVAHILGLRFHSKGTPRTQLLSYLCRKRMLLILDSFEHLLQAANLVVDILRTAPNVKILITSRVKLNVGFEQLVPITGLECPEAESIGKSARCTQDAMQYSAIQLFLIGACRVRPDFELIADDVVHIARICRLVSGLPLAILLAARWVEVLTPIEIAAQVSGESGEALDFLAADWCDLPARQRSMRTVFDHSWNLLSNREREILSALSVFRGEFSSQAARQVACASLRELLALVDKSLVHRTPAGRYEMNELLRQYAAGKLRESSGTATTTQDRHSTSEIRTQLGMSC